MERELLLRLDGVGRRYGFRGAWVLRGVDLEIAPGALIRVEGANGTGKSTLLRVLAGLDAPTEGRVTGRPRTAYVPERFPAALPFTAAEYLTHLGAVHGLDRPAAAHAAAEWLERFGAAEYARTPMAELSKGSSQKVAVAQALLAEPELIVLDEAWTGLDADARDELERVVVERTAAGAAAVFVDHDPRRLAGMPDATYAVVGGSLDLLGGKGTSRAETGDLLVAASASVSAAASVVVEGRGPSGAQVPDEVGKLATAVSETASGAHRFTVPQAGSDVLLRALLEARPPWHVVSVGPASAPADSLEPEPEPELELELEVESS
ncbi:ABC transporter ATP-binding protein [Streptomyces europaeiscabiei]|uniref:ABC transporter ATP-binding protein n=1 Tax=Streptomyces europaeiscabiei TaxID=146819 RepID=UPI0029B60E63|nr:ABC transporter ATP-binding protein [Streptomyces europaeiscabiei]MDX3692076.1 ABC transporter ATP-binding protein [Streptomyces europaeiscabiei]